MKEKKKVGVEASFTPYTVECVQPFWAPFASFLADGVELWEKGLRPENEKHLEEKGMFTY